MRTVESYRGLQVHVFDPDEEIPGWVRGDVTQGRSLVARGEFNSTSALAHILDRYIDEVLSPQADAPPRPPGPRAQRFPGGRR